MLPHPRPPSRAHEGDPLARRRTGKFLEQEDKRLIRLLGRVPKAHLTGLVPREVGVEGPINQHQSNLVAEMTSSGCIALGRRQCPTSCANRDLHFISQTARNLFERGANPRSVVEHLGCTATRRNPREIVSFGKTSRHHAIESTSLRLSYCSFRFPSGLGSSQSKKISSDSASTVAGICVTISLA
jgi:hypothetical protein